MKIIILSTISKHHTYFINKIIKNFNSTYVIFTKVNLKKKYKVGPFYFKEENKFEDNFFKKKENISRKINKKKIIFKNVKNINSKVVEKRINHLRPDIGIAFGTQLIKKNIYNLPRFGFINIHRGLTQFYRGLDSDLWPLLEKKFNRLGVTIHYIDENYDTGGILSQKKIHLKKKNEIFHLRYITTILATEIVINILNKFNKKKYKLPSRKLFNRGKYKSSMPIQFKYIAEKNLNNYLKSL